MMLKLVIHSGLTYIMQRLGLIASRRLVTNYKNGGPISVLLGAIVIGVKF